MTFGHIAHTDLDGFYNTWFERAFHQYGFVDKALRWRCPGDPACTYCDVEAALQQWLRSVGALHLLAARHAAEREARERAELHRCWPRTAYHPSFGVWRFPLLAAAAAHAGTRTLAEPAPQTLPADQGAHMVPITVTAELNPFDRGTPLLEDVRASLEGTAIHDADGADRNADRRVGQRAMAQTPTHTNERVLSALNRASDDILKAVDAPATGLRDGLNLLVNAAMSYLKDEAHGLEAVVAANWDGDTTLEDVLGWIQDGT